MSGSAEDMKADIGAVADRGEATTAMEPLVLSDGSRHRPALSDVAVELGIRLTIEDSWGGDLTSAAVSHLGASTPPHALFAVSFMNDWTDNHLAGYQPRSVEGRGSAPTTPGLGVTVDPSVLGPPVATWS